MEKKKTHIRAEVDSNVKRKFEGAYKLIGISYNDALERAMILFTAECVKEAVKNKRG